LRGKRFFLNWPSSSWWVFFPWLYWVSLMDQSVFSPRLTGFFGEGTSSPLNSRLQRTISFFLFLIQDPLAEQLPHYFSGLCISLFRFLFSTFSPLPVTMAALGTAFFKHRLHPGRPIVYFSPETPFGRLLYSPFTSPNCHFDMSTYLGGGRPWSALVQSDPSPVHAGRPFLLVLFSKFPELTPAVGLSPPLFTGAGGTSFLLIVFFPLDFLELLWNTSFPPETFPL